MSNSVYILIPINTGLNIGFIDLSLLFLYKYLLPERILISPSLSVSILRLNKPISANKRGKLLSVRIEIILYRSLR